MKEIKLNIPDITFDIAERNSKELGFQNVNDYLTMCAIFALEEFSPDVYAENSNINNIELHQFNKDMMSRIDQTKLDDL